MVLKPTLVTGTFYKGKVGTSYSHTTAFTGCTKYYANGLPAGLSMGETTGAITGTPTESGEFSVSVYGVDTYGNMSNVITGTIEIEPASV